MAKCLLFPLLLTALSTTLRSEWAITGSMSEPRAGHSATLLEDGKVLVVGGANTLNTETYDPLLKTWSLVGQTSAVRHGHTATLLSSGHVLVTGGYSGANGVTSGVEIYDPTTHSWTVRTSLNAARVGHSAALLTDGRLLVAGGSRASNIISNCLRSAEIYDPNTNVWTNTGSMNVPRCNPIMAMLPDGKVLVSGGRDGSGVVNGYLSNAEIYDAATGLWQMTGSMTDARSYMPTVLLGNSPYAIGGHVNDYAIVATADSYDYSTGTWHSTSPMSHGRYAHSATAIDGHRLIVVGGFADGPAFSDVELYDATNNTWSGLPSLNIARTNHTATFLKNGSLLVAGGRNNSDLSSAEILTLNYSITISELQHGAVSPSGQSYQPNTTATLTAVPSPGYTFTGWTGDASGTTNPLSILMDANKTVGATFAPDLSDADGDLLTAFDEATIHGTDPTKADTDGDGLHDGYELGIGRFAVVPGSRTWTQAKAHAIAQGGTLATFATEGEWSRALLSIGESALYEIGGLWIGATDETTEGTWTWITGEPFGFSNWATGQPDNLNDSDYAAVAGDLGGTFGKWYDYRGTTTRDGYIFETGYSTDPTDPDSDNDGLDDGAEQLAGSNPFMADTDGDGLSDPQEVNLTHTHPYSADTDGDGINDANDDEDGDSLANLAEITQHGTDPRKADTDGDGLSDSAELSHPDSYFALVTGSFTYPQAAADAAAKRGRVASFPNRADYNHMAVKARQSTQGYLWIGLSDTAAEGTWVWTNGTAATYEEWLGNQPDGSAGENQAIIMENSRQWADAAGSFIAAGYLFERVGLDPLAADTDGDGLSDGQEVNTVHSDPTLDDTDGDGLLDGAEVNAHGSSPLKTDTDEDGLNDREEVVTYHSNPAVKDTDGDGFDDFFEVNTGFDPALASSTPDALSSIRTAVEFRFNAANGISYRIEASTDLNEWTIIEPVVIGQGGVVTRFYSIENQPKRYFRVRRN